MDFCKLKAEFSLQIPSQRTTEDASSEVIISILRIAHHDRKVFGDVAEEDVERVHLFDAGFGLEDAVVEHGLIW